MIQTGLIAEAPKPLDWVCGEETGVSVSARLGDGNWFYWLPSFEKQCKDFVFDTMSCATFSALNCIETQIKWLRSNGFLSPEAENFLKNFGFIDAKGDFNASDRFIAIMSKTTKEGNQMSNVWDAIRTYGLLPEKDLPFGGNSFEEYHGARITGEMLNKARAFKDFFQVNYDWVCFPKGNPTYIEKIKIANALKFAPLQAGIPYPAFHAVETYKLDGGTISYYDHYDNKYRTRDQMNFLLRGVVSLKEAPKTYEMPKYEFTRDLKIGSGGKDVEMLQQVLIALGILKIVPKGYFGPITKQAVANFQARNGLPTTGNCLKMTREKLNSLTK